jgi:acyl carrier protein
MDDVGDRVMGVVCSCLANEAAGLETSFGALGATSLDLLDLRFQLRREFARDIPARWLQRSRCGRDVVHYLRGGHPPVLALV